jgi:hypothetical protein
MLNSQEINILGQILNTTYGESSTRKSPTMSIKGQMSGDTLTLNYTTICHLASERNMRDQVKVFEDQSVKLIKEFVSNMKKDFKEVSGRALKLKELSSDDSVELITASAFSPRKTAYYRRFTTFRCE